MFSRQDCAPYHIFNKNSAHILWRAAHPCNEVNWSTFKHVWYPSRSRYTLNILVITSFVQTISGGKVMRSRHSETWWTCLNRILTRLCQYFTEAQYCTLFKQDENYITYLIMHKIRRDNKMLFISIHTFKRIRRDRMISIMLWSKRHQSY